MDETFIVFFDEKVLLSAGSAVNTTDNLGRTPVMWAAGRGNFEVVEVRNVMSFITVIPQFVL